MLQDVKTFVERLDQLPTISPVAVKLIEVSTSSDTGLRQVARIIKSDQSLASKLLRLANSAGFSRGRRIATIEQATSLLGLDLVRSAALSVVAMDFFNGQDSTHFDIKALWRHSATCAVGSELLALRLQHPQPKEAFIAGLLHDIGKLVLHKWNGALYDEVLEEAREDRKSLLDVEERRIGVGHTWAAKMLMDTWRFPERLREAVWLHHQPIGQFNGASHRSLAFIVSCSNSLCHHFRFGNSGNPGGELSVDEVSDVTGVSVDEIIELSTEVLTHFDELAGQFDWKENSAHLYLNSVLEANQELSRIYGQLEESNRSLHRRNTTMTAIRRMEEAVIPPARIGEALKKVVQHLGEAVAVRTTAGFVPDRDGKQLLTVLQHGVDERQSFSVPLDDGPLDDLPQRRQVAMIIQAFQEHGDPEQVESLMSALRSPDLIVAPMQADQRTIGQLFIELDTERVSRPQNIELVREYARSAALALDKVLLFEELDRQSENLAQMARNAEAARTRLFHSERLASVGRLAAGAAHEINNPLTIVSAQTQLLLNRAGAQDSQALTNILQQSERIAKIVKDLMGLARPAQPQVEPTSLTAVVEHTLGVLSERIRTAGIEVQVRLPKIPDIPVDPKQIEQVFLNLTINALQAMPDGGELKVSIEHDPERRQVRILFADTGHGIATGHLDAVFDPFFSTKEEGEGMGLGLAISHSIIESHSGRLAVRSREGQGTTFTVTLPTDGLQPGASVKADVVVATPTVIAKKGQGRVLIVDDEEALGRVLAEVLRAEGYRVDTVDNAEKALARLGRSHYDAAVVDIKMPGMSGVDLMDEIRRRSPHLPIIAITGSKEKGELSAAADKASAILNKPFDMTRFKDVLRETLEAAG